MAVRAPTPADKRRVVSIARALLDIITDYRVPATLAAEAERDLQDLYRRYPDIVGPMPIWKEE